jgi:transposase
MRAYSEDLRQRIVQAVHEGVSRATVAQQFRVSRRTVDRYLRQVRQTGQLTPGRSSGRPRLLAAGDEAHLRAQLAAQPAARLDTHCRTWAERTGVVCSQATMSRAIARLGWTRKKGQWQPVSAMRTCGLPGGMR